MKVFKIIKYHIPYRQSSTAGSLCGKSRDIFICTYKIAIPNIKQKVLVYNGKQKLIEYNENMDMCKTCRQMNFRYMVNKLKGKGSF